MKKLSLALLFAVLLFPLSAQAQNTIAFAYDAAGNRIQRYIEIPAERSVSQPEENIPPVTDTALGNTITIYPNPTKGLLKVDIENFKEEQQGSIVIYDMKGQAIVSHKKVFAANELDITNTSAGNYILRITLDKKTTEWKIIKQ